MVWVVGLLTLGALIWLLAGMMATESESERRRLSALAMHSSTNDEATSQSAGRRAA